MPDAASRLVGPTALAAAAVTVGTVPAATTWLLRNIHVVNTSANAVAFTLSIGADAAGTRLYSALQIPGNGALDWSGFLVVNAGEVIQAYASIASVLTLVIAGVART